MTAYLLDENVLREFGARGNMNVRKWLASVDDADLRLSVATLFEKRRGAEMLKRRDRERAERLLKAITAQNASIEEQRLTKYSRQTKVKFVGVWDTVGSLGLPLASVAVKVRKYRFFDTHLRLDNEYAFDALALDEHRKNFEPTFWTRTDKVGHEGAAERRIDSVEQR